MEIFFFGILCYHESTVLKGGTKHVSCVGHIGRGGKRDQMGGVPKQFLHLGSMTVVEHSIIPLPRSFCGRDHCCDKEEEISRMKSC